MDQNFVTGRNTFVEWNHQSSGVCVLPVGAFEQHSYHLPLATDALLAEYFGTLIARELGAALLPTLSIGTSYEHSGFRGSFSLKPETTIAVIRDLAEEAERQNFHTMILVNWHGGNFSLPPVVREFNRQDRPLKIILCFPPGPGSINRLELHAGEWETSVMLHLFPELVRETRVDVTNPRWLTGEVTRADLNLYGVGYIAPAGALGLPGQATAEKGAQIVAQIKHEILIELKQRLQWLARDSRFSGAGGITLRPMQPVDFDAAMALKTSAGWNQTRTDWENLFALRPEGCFVAVRLAKVLGTVTTINYQNRFSWIGMVLVSPLEQRQGIGTQLMAAAMASLVDCETIKLDATPAGKTVYDRLGFQDEYRLVRLMRTPGPLPETDPRFTIRAISETDLAAIATLDVPVFGANRAEVIKCWYQAAPEFAFALFKDQEIAGYCLGRHGANFDQIGPIVCQTLEQARQLLISAVGLTDRTLVLDTGIFTRDWQKILTELGFERQREFIRMFKGPNRFPGNPAWQWAIAGPEIG